MAFSTHDIVPDSPTNNFATLNPLNLNSSHSKPTDGNLKIAGHPPYLYNGGIYSNMSISKNDSNLYYAEFACLGAFNSTGYFRLGIGTDNYQPTNSGAQSKPDVDSNGIGFETSGTSIISNNTNVFTIGTSFSAPDTTGIWQILVKGSTGEVWFGKNNNLLNSGSPVASISGDYNHLSFFIQVYTPSDIWCVNFGQDHTFGGAKSPSTTYTDANGIGSFYYQPPTNALALCTANLPDFTPDVDDDTPQDYFKAVTYTGDGTTTKEVTIGFVPDLCWIKPRSWGNFNTWIDSVRGGNKHLYSDQTLAERNSPNSLDAILDFNSGGTNDKIKIGYESGWEFLNKTNETHVAWCWKAGGAAVTNNDGSITSTVSANTDAGFSIVTYTGTGANATWGHGLSSAPEMVIIKGRTNTAGWGVYHSALGPTKRLSLNTTDASETMGYFQNTSPTSTVFYITSNGGTGASGVNYIAYCWHSVEGYSKFGSYTGNNSADGPFVYTGFRVGWLMVKDIDTNGAWVILDNKRSEFNVVAETLFPHLANQESSLYDQCDFLSNGFKWRADNTNSWPNHISGNRYIYMAFAEQPFKFSNAR